MNNKHKYKYLKVRVQENIYNVFNKVLKINKKKKQEIIELLLRQYILDNFSKLELDKEE